MGHKRRWRYRARQKDMKHSSSAGRGELPVPPFACGKCGFQGMDAYDLSCHLRDNNYCGAGNVAAFATAINAASSTILEDSSSSGDDNEPPLEEGDSFMYNDHWKTIRLPILGNLKLTWTVVVYPPKIMDMSPV
jgi:hypothetical protein